MLVLILTWVCLQDPAQNAQPPSTVAATTNGSEGAADYQILEKRIQKLEGFVNWFIPGSIFVLFGGIWAFVNLKKWAREKVEKRLDEVLKHKADLLLEHVNSLDRDQQYLREKKILILSAEGASPSSWPILKKMGFDCVTDTFPEVVDQTALEALEEKKYDLIIFDHLTAESLDAYARISNKENFIGYTSESLNVSQRKRFQFSNAPCTLYSRIFELFRYEDAIS